MKSEEVKEHLDSCNDKKAMAEHKKKVRSRSRRSRNESRNGSRSRIIKGLFVQVLEAKASAAQKESKQESQEEVMAFKTWEHNGRQVGRAT